MGATIDEFPLLAACGLYAAQIRGDGNCLFNALSDQLYGSQSSHYEIRARVIDYMRENASYFKQFVDVHPGGGYRRNPKRKNAGSFSTPLNYMPPTSEEVDRVFESHLQQMAKGGTYGDNLEITAFSAAFNIDVRIVQRDSVYVISRGKGEGKRQMVHIAYHTWEHYSSIRNINGPHTGPPHVKAISIDPEIEKKCKENLVNTSYVQPWAVNIVLHSLPYLADKQTIERALEESKGNLNDAVSRLLDADDRISNSSNQGSSSAERELESDEETFRGPNKKQDRRLSRATATILKERAEQRSRELTQCGNISSNPESSSVERDPCSDEETLDGLNKQQRRRLSRATATLLKERAEQRKRDLAIRLRRPQGSAKPGSISEIAKHDQPKDPREEEDDEETEEEDWRNDPTYVDIKSPHVAGTTTIKPAYSGIRIKLSQPRRENEIYPPHPQSRHLEISSGPGKTQQRQLGPKQKRLTNRDKKDLKKAAQKAAAKERKQSAAAGNNVLCGGKDTLATLATKKGKESSPVTETGIKELWI